MNNESPIYIVFKLCCESAARVEQNKADNSATNHRKL